MLHAGRFRCIHCYIHDIPGMALIVFDGAQASGLLHCVVERCSVGLTLAPDISETSDEIVPITKGSHVLYCRISECENGILATSAQPCTIARSVIQGNLYYGIVVGVGAETVCLLSSNRVAHNKRANIWRQPDALEQHELIADDIISSESP
jgi:hypothetical protein